MTAAWRMALVAASADSVVRLRADLVHDILMRHAILCVTPPASAHEVRALRELGVSHRAVDLDPQGIPLLANWTAERALRDVFQDWQPHIVLGCGLPVAICAAIAARKARVRRIVSMCSGFPKTVPSFLERRRLANALQASHAVIFHNRDDLGLAKRLGVLPKGAHAIVVPGSGVNLHRHTRQALPSRDNGLVFLMLGRLERASGVADYVAAARSLNRRAPGCQYLLAGPPGRGAQAVAPEALAAHGAPVEYLGNLDDVRGALAACHVFVYPSHAEGMPRAVLEALATGRPVITTDAPGCRDTVDDKVSGCLVPAGDPEALAAAMESFVKRPDLISATANAARLKAERRFDVQIVNRAVAEVLEVS